MNKKQNLIYHLNSLIDILEEEKHALITSNGDKIAEIVEVKNKYIEGLSDFQGIDREKDVEIVNLVEEIHFMQELNLLLTKQALSFHNSLLEGISQEIKDASSTYSSKGNYNNSGNVGIIDQKV